MKNRFAAPSALLLALAAAHAFAYTAPPEPDGSANSVQASSSMPDWYWVPIKGAKCRFDDPDANPAVPGPATTGIAVRYNPNATKVVITMQGGGACFSGASCAGNLSRYGFWEFENFATGSLPGTKLNDGLWSTSYSSNQLAEYTEVFIPYCSGDFHAGNQVSKILGVVWPYTTLLRPINFAGYKNTGLYFDYITKKLLPPPAAPKREVLLSGFSAGAFGATLNAPRLRTLLDSNVNWKDVKLSLLNDSGPFFDSSAHGALPANTLMSGCVQNRWHTTWGLSKILENCPACTTSNWLNPFLVNFLQSQPNVPFAFTSSQDDGVVQGFMGSSNGGSSCGNDVTATEYTQGLNDIRSQMAALRATAANTATFFVPGTEHCAIQNSRYFSLVGLTTTPVRQTRGLREWTENLFERPSIQGWYPPVYDNVAP